MVSLLPVTFLSDFRVVASVVASYLVGIWLITNLPNAVKSRVSASFIFKALVSIHSLILCLGSLGMFAGGLVAYRNVSDDDDDDARHGNVVIDFLLSSLSNSGIPLCREELRLACV